MKPPKSATQPRRRVGRPRVDPFERFWRKVRQDGCCWIWTGGTRGGGYGSFAITHSDTVLAHRWAYEWIVGVIPDGLHLEHKCGQRLCVNPAHLKLMRRGENLMRWNKTKETQ